MKQSIKKIAVFLGALIVNGVVPFAAFAQSFQNPIKADSIQAFIVDLLNLVVALGSIIAVFFIIYSGFLFVKARGNPEEIEKAKGAILWTVIGTAVLLGAKVIAVAISATIKQVGGPGL